MFQWISSKVFRKNANSIPNPERNQTENQLEEPPDEAINGVNEETDEEE